MTFTIGRRLLAAGLLAALPLAALLGAAAVLAAAGESAYLNATLWTQRAPEHRAAVLALFRLAALRLDEALRDSAWTAAPAEQEAPFADKPPAVVLDLDETVLDNSPFVARLAARALPYDAAAAADWERWVEAAAAPALPGAVDFIDGARARGVAVYFVSNREAVQEEATRRNLAAVGIAPDEGGEDRLLLQGERPCWSTLKGERRRAVAEQHRILLLLGDSLEDFVDGARADALTDGAPDPHAARWGREWILLPNPMYGLWEEAAYGFDYDLPRAQQVERLRERLRPWDGR